jgi:hypothetical protein
MFDGNSRMIYLLEAGYQQERTKWDILRVTHGTKKMSVTME